MVVPAIVPVEPVLMTTRLSAGRGVHGEASKGHADAALRPPIVAKKCRRYTQEDTLLASKRCPTAAYCPLLKCASQSPLTWVDGYEPGPQNGFL